MQRFVHFQNLNRFVEALEQETDPPKRDLLKQLLLEELNGFGDRRERLEQAEEFIVRGQERIRRQREIVSGLEGAGKDVDIAKAGLFNLVQTQSIFEAFHQILLSEGAQPLA